MDQPSLRHFVHHKNGEIVGTHVAEADQSMPGAETIEVAEGASGVSAKTHKVVDDELVPKTAEEVAAAHAPTMADVKSTLLAELQRSDYTQLPDSPCSDVERDGWRQYRAALRALYKGTDAQAVLAAMPSAPDGVRPNMGIRFKMGELLARRSQNF